MTDLLAGPGTPGIPVIEVALTAAPRPDPRAIQRVQRIRKAVLLVAILGVIGLSMATTPALSGTAAHALILGAGLLALVVAIVGRAWCSLYIGGRKKSEIVDKGPYSITRNPLYVFSFIGAFGMGAQTGSLILAALFLSVAIAVFLATVKQEEAWLLDAFPASYPSYLEATPRFWPRLSIWRDVNELSIAPKYFLRTLRDGSVMLLAIPCFWGIAMLHEASRLPTVFRLI